MKTASRRQANPAQGQNDRRRGFTLVLTGARDPIVPPVNGRIIAAGLPQATLETVDCGHLFVLTRAAQTARRVERFMDQHATARV